MTNSRVILCAGYFFLSFLRGYYTLIRNVSNPLLLERTAKLINAIFRLTTVSSCEDGKESITGVGRRINHAADIHVRSVGCK